MKNANSIYILSNGRVAAINKKDGSIIWEIKLREYIGSGTMGSIGQIYTEEEKLYIGISGRVLCLSAKDGSLLWKNELKGWGYQFISIANVQPDAAAQDAQNRNAAVTTSAVTAAR